MTNSSNMQFATSVLSRGDAASVVDRTRGADRESPTWTMANIASDGKARWPNRLALTDGSISLTFSELERCARQLSGRLAEWGVGPGDRVAVAGDGDVDTVVAILGISMRGACYVPLDSTQPVERLRFLLEDAEVRGLVGSEDLRGLVQAENGRRFFVELAGVSKVPELAAPWESLPAADPARVAYIMYTSGSTGLPKGVQIEHQSVRAFFEAHNERVAIRPGDRCLNSGPFHFDVSLLAVFLPLHAGASVYFGSKLPIPTLVLGALARYQITHFYAVASVLSLITGDGRWLDRHDLRSLRVLQTGAEVCSVRVVNEWLQRCPELQFLNSYGPTEATVGCISYLKPTLGPIEVESCPIGLPHRGTNLALLSPTDALLTGAGEVGELAIAGRQLMRSYWRRDVENDRAFVWLQGVRYYRSGDQAYRDAEGRYHFVGRRDDEIKLNGHRIHLNEVLRGVLSDTRIESAVAGVLTREAGPRELVVLAVPSGPLSLELLVELEKRAAETLPRAMRPTRWALLRAFPRLSSGKVDREACLLRLTEALNAHDASHYCELNQALLPAVNP